MENVARALRERNNGRIHAVGNQSRCSEIGGAGVENRMPFEHRRAIRERRPVLNDGCNADAGNGAGFFKRPINANDRGHENFNAAILLE